MTRLIISEQQAERIGEDRTGGKRGEAFEVLRTIHSSSKLTIFYVKTKAGVTIAVA